MVSLTGKRLAGESTGRTGLAEDFSSDLERAGGDHRRETRVGIDVMLGTDGGGGVGSCGIAFVRLTRTAIVGSSGSAAGCVDRYMRIICAMRSVDCSPWRTSTLFDP